MTEYLADIRARVHRKSHDYFTLGYERQEKAKWRMFYGATDALLDASTAASAFSVAVKSDAAINLLVCYGFLQALYIQQDAVWILSEAVGLQWHPSQDSRIMEIRDIRNRLTGHPARAGASTQPKRMSSAIISYDDVQPNRFKGHIYYENKYEPVEINVTSILEQNEACLSIQMRKIETKMDDDERRFRIEQTKKPLSDQFGQGFDYLVQRLSCDLNDPNRLPQAETHLRMIRDRVNDLKSELDGRGFASSATVYHLARVLAGLGILEALMRKNTHSEDDQYQFDLVFAGVEKNLNSLRSFTSEIDARLKEEVI